MPINWNEQAQWVDEAIEKARELGCSGAEYEAVVSILTRFAGAPSRVLKLATYYLEHMIEISEEIERDRKARETN